MLRVNLPNEHYREGSERGERALLVSIPPPTAPHGFQMRPRAQLPVPALLLQHGTRVDEGGQPGGAEQPRAAADHEAAVEHVVDAGQLLRGRVLEGRAGGEAAVREAIHDGLESEAERILN